MLALIEDWSSVGPSRALCRSRWYTRTRRIGRMYIREATRGTVPKHVLVGLITAIAELWLLTRKQGNKMRSSPILLKVWFAPPFVRISWTRVQDLLCQPFLCRTELVRAANPFAGASTSLIRTTDGIGNHISVCSSRPNWVGSRASTALPETSMSRAATTSFCPMHTA